eukprot:gene12925-8782_t
MFSLRFSFFSDALLLPLHAYFIIIGILSAEALMSANSPPAAQPGASPVPLCTCATCGASHFLPRPDPSQPTFQCQQCRLLGADTSRRHTRAVPYDPNKTMGTAVTYVTGCIWVGSGAGCLTEMIPSELSSKTSYRQKYIKKNKSTTTNKHYIGHRHVFIPRLIPSSPSPFLSSFFIIIIIIVVLFGIRVFFLRATVTTLQSFAQRAALEAHHNATTADLTTHFPHERSALEAKVSECTKGLYF